MNLSIKEINELIYSLGITAHNGNFCNREVNEALLEKLYCELNERIAEDEPEYDSAGFTFEDNFRSHFVSNEEADEDAFTDHLLGADLDYMASVEQDSQRYEVNKRAPGLITQKLLDYVDEKGAVSYGELHEYYKSITGSNSFSHVLTSLCTPYKNRPTQRYLAKEGKPYSDAKYIVKLANPSNWVVNDSDYRTFNEAPYGND